METHKVEVLPVTLLPHPNADTLSIVKIHDFTCCVRTADWKDGDLAAYVQPDSIVDSTRPEFSFLAGSERIRVKKLRGVVSMGLLVKAPEGLQPGEDAALALGVTHYEPPLPNASSNGETEAPPSVYAPNYDVESMYRYAHLFEEGEPVIATEKIHGANGRWTFHDGRMWAGSKREWKKYSASNLWWKAIEQSPWIEEFCKENQGLVVYGEVFGNVQSLKYGCAQGQYRIAVFDVMMGSTWFSVEELAKCEFKPETGFGLQLVPCIYSGPFNLDNLKKLAEGPSMITGANHIREGIVVKPLVERTSIECGRVQLKLVSNAYLEKY